MLVVFENKCNLNNDFHTGEKYFQSERREDMRFHRTYGVNCSDTAAVMSRVLDEVWSSNSSHWAEALWRV